MTRGFLDQRGGKALAGAVTAQMGHTPNGHTVKADTLASEPFEDPCLSA